MVLGVLIPSVNTTVQPEFEGMRPSGVSNQTGRFALPDLSHFGSRTNEALDAIVAEIASAMDMLRAAVPDAIALAYSTEYLAGGYVSAKRIGIVTPYADIGNTHVKAFFEQGGYTFTAIAGAPRAAGTSAAATREKDIRAAFDIVDGDGVDARVTDSGHYQPRAVASGQRSSAFDWGDRWSGDLRQFWRRMSSAIRV
jgi:maleate isomerase